RGGVGAAAGAARGAAAPPALDVVEVAERGRTGERGGDDRPLHVERLELRTAIVAVRIPGAYEDVVGAERQDDPGVERRDVVLVDVGAVRIDHVAGDRV